MDVVTLALAKQFTAKAVEEIKTITDTISKTEASSYNPESTYSVGSLVIYENKLYRCITAVTIPEEFDSEKWEEVTISVLLSGKADLVNGKVPTSQLPAYVSETIEVATYNDLPNPGEAGYIYVTLDDGKSYRWGGSTYVEVGDRNTYFSVPVENMSTMGELRTYVDGINSQGLHCFFDFHTFITNAYVCTVLMFTQSSVNYCLVFDIINGRTYLNYNGYQDNETIASYLAGNEDNLIRTLKITDANTTMADISVLLTKVNTFGHHVMFDVSALNTGAYLCTILTDGSTSFKVMDVVSQKVNSVAYSANTTLLSVLQGMSELVDTASNQTITGVKTFDSNLTIAANKKITLIGTQTWDIQNNTTDLTFYKQGLRQFYVNGSGIIPTENNAKTLGESGRKWKHLYLSNVINPNLNNYGLSIPDTAGWTANKEILTSDSAGIIAINPPASTTLTDAEYAIFTSGKIIKVNGTFLSSLNPVFFPATKYFAAGNEYRGLCFRPSTANYVNGGFYIYRISVTKEISVMDNYNIFFNDLSGTVEIKKASLTTLVKILGKELPAYPSNTGTFNFKQVNGTLSWLEQLYGEEFTNSTTELTYEKINNVSISADTTFTLKTAQTNCLPTYEANIENTSSSAIVITLTGITKINTNDANITIVNNTFTLPGNTSVEVNIQNAHALVYKW